MLHCSTCRQKLTAYQESTLDPASRAQVEAHLRECPDCARELRREAAIKEALHSIGSTPAPVELRSRVRTAIQAEKARKPALSWASLWNPLGMRNSGLTWAGGATAAAFALLLLVRLNPELTESHLPAPSAANPQAPAAETSPLDQNGVAQANKPIPAVRKPISSRGAVPKTVSKPAAPAAASAKAVPGPRPAPQVRHMERPVAVPPQPHFEAAATADAALPPVRVQRPTPTVQTAPPRLAKAEKHAPVPATGRVSTERIRPIPGAAPIERLTKNSAQADMPPAAQSTPAANVSAAPVATPAAPTAAPEAVFTVSAGWDENSGKAASPLAARIMGRNSTHPATNPNTATASGMAPVTNVAPLAAPGAEANTLAPRGVDGGTRIVASTPSTNGGTDATAASDSAPEPNRRLNLVLMPLQDVTGGRVRIQIAADAATHSSAFETVLWEGDAHKNEALRLFWNPPAAMTNIPPITVVLEAVGADEHTRTLQTQLVVVPPQPGATTK